MCTTGPLEITTLKLHCEKNNREHHTSDISVSRLILRRGQRFELTFLTTRPVFEETDTVLLIVETGPSPSESKGTRSVFGFPLRVGGKGKWKVQLLESSSSSFTMGITSPADACVGSYKLSIRLGSENAIPQTLASLLLLFNPWCAEDWVHLPREDERQEYVMAEQGDIYRGTHHYMSSMDWSYGQFEEDILDICLKLLDMNPKCLRDAEEDFSARCNPIYVGRVVSAMINANGDRGVLAGKWQAPYTGGVAPTHWDDSVDILRHWRDSNYSPVKYGQCWVYAAVMCTVMRCLGIPCRVVTNFQSAHDTDKNLTIDKYYSDDGVQPKEGHDSVWNFHVWVEAWMKRPDLAAGSTYDGWQVLDPTPQEKSTGVFCCGPTPVKAILEGHTDMKYDVGFVFAEVNADQVTWLLQANGSKSRLYTDTRSVGKNISTKAVGRDRREDITANYKYPEGLQRERQVFEEAVRRGNNTTPRCGGALRPPTPVTQVTQTTLRPSQVTLQIAQTSVPIDGKDVEMSLSLRSDHASPRELSVRLVAQAMRFTGVADSQVWSATENVTLQPRREHKIPIRIPYHMYGAKMLDNSSLKISAVVRDKQRPGEVYFTDEDFALESPKLTIETKGSCEQYSEMTATITFHNELSVPLKNCVISVGGSGLLNVTTDVRVSDVAPGEILRVPMRFTPYRVGFRKLVADFDCNVFRDIKAHCYLNIKPRQETSWCGVVPNSPFYDLPVVRHYAPYPLMPTMMAMTLDDDIVLGAPRY
ncbi:protein-glutamine gamma-glutamyltransferase 2-like [Sardina pilchardus]|uniref:protein-glutamine gamma-glutamyltransferase 2-like n=1 Tax=Sardina pilchardus TaxID=27697 RepID=UPI002E113A5A